MVFLTENGLYEVLMQSRKPIAKVFKKEVKLKNSKVLNRDIRKLANRGEKFITESGVYKLIFKSKNKEAERFQDLVTDEVLPQIRQTGGYIRYNKYRLLRRITYARKYDR